MVRLRHRPASTRARAKSAKIVKAHDVIGVRVRENDGIDPADIFAQRLRPEIGAGIDHDDVSGVSM